ncbi:UDP-glucuronosyl/UDP-glucosyltransferase [Sesbania bispinosa]|nr:UDP-glucuronosyl/UDP-glucosyltransferase [Sesbania bispinosa]
MGLDIFPNPRELLEGFDSKQKKNLRQMGDDELVTADINSQDKIFDSDYSKKAEDWKENLGQKSSEVSSSPQIGLDHFIIEPVGTERNLHIADHEIMLSRSMMEKWGSPRDDLMLDRLSENEKQKLIVNLLKMQNDGTVEVDLEKSAPVASELLELQSYEESTEYGHHVRLATHADFDSFVKSAGVDFYPLGGDPRALAGYMVRNKGLIPSGPTEISIQRKQLKAIIDSLLPACTGPDLETGVPFRAQAIISNPTACGHVHVAEALGVPLHIFFTMPWTPTYEFPHPLARVPQSAGYWLFQHFLAAIQLSYIIVDLLIWWGIRGIINDFRKRKLKLAPIAYFSMYHGSTSHLPTAYMWSPHVVPKPSGMNMDPLEDPRGTTDVIMEALKDTEQRGIIDRGWGNLGNLAEVPDNVFLLEECPHDWLFPQCSAVVHHGGAGTTATGLKAGCPTTIIPFFGDQFFWGDRIYEKGLGPAPIPISQLSLEHLSNAIKFMLQPEVKSRAMEIAKLIENEDGVAAAVDAFHRHLPPQLPLPTPSPVEEDHANPLQWFFLRLAKLCCLPCGGV